MSEKRKPPGFLEKIGDRYFASLSQKEGRVVEEDEIHILNPDELAALRRVERNAVLRAAAAGSISGLLCAITALLAWPLLGADPDHPDTSHWLQFFLVVTLVSVVISVGEIVWLYYDSLRSVHQLATVAGLELYPGSGEVNAVRLSLIRAAMEMPNPPEEETTLNPLRETSKFRLFLVSTAFKLKVTASSIIFKMIVGRIGGRVIARKYLDFFGMPIYALWDGVTIYRVMREARIRAMGPSAVEGLLEMRVNKNKLSTQCRIAILQAVGSSIVTTADLHPNHHAMLRALYRRMEIAEGVEIDNTERFLKTLQGLNADEQRVVVEVLGIAIAIDGRLARKEVELYRDARKICKMNNDISFPLKLKDQFRAGMSMKELTFT
jgi:hypothetical protein